MILQKKELRSAVMHIRAKPAIKGKLTEICKMMKKSQAQIIEELIENVAIAKE